MIHSSWLVDLLPLIVRTSPLDPLGIAPKRSNRYWMANMFLTWLAIRAVDPSLDMMVIALRRLSSLDWALEDKATALFHIWVMFLPSTWAFAPQPMVVHVTSAWHCPKARKPTRLLNRVTGRMSRNKRIVKLETKVNHLWQKSWYSYQGQMPTCAYRKMLTGNMVQVWKRDRMWVISDGITIWRQTALQGNFTVFLAI